MTLRSQTALGLVTPLLFFGVVGCAAPTAADDASGLAPFLVREIPETAHRAYVDFGGKLALVACELSPDGKAGPGQNVTAKLYWKRIGEVSPHWGLFTHLEDARGRQLKNIDQEGQFRKWLGSKATGGLELLELGSVYVDEQSFEMPKAEDLTPQVLLVVGAYIEDQPLHYTNLPVVSGPSDGHEAGIVARIDTGLAWPKLAAKHEAKDVRR